MRGRKPHPHRHGPTHKGLWLIALFKLAKGTLLFLIGIGALRLMHKDVAALVEHWANALHVDPDNKYFHAVIERLGILTDKHLLQISLGTFFYSALLYTEGVGLYLEKRWAEFLTIIATSVFIPIEIYELFRHFTWVKVGVLTLNLVIVLYLYRLVRKS